jgi:hypothetical protein
MQVPRSLVLAAVAIGIAGGSYGVASAANATSTSTATTTAATRTGASPGSAPDPQRPWGGQRSDETPLTGDALAKVTAIAKAKVPSGSVVRVETDANGNAKYEAHMTDASGAPVTVYMDAGFTYVATESR